MLTLLLASLLAAPSGYVFGGPVQTKTYATMSPSDNPCTAAVDFSKAVVYYIDLESCGGAMTVTVSNLADGASGVVVIRQDSGADLRTVAFAAGAGTLYWPAATAPTMTQTADKTDVFSFLYIAATTSWFGSSVQNF